MGNHAANLVVNFERKACCKMYKLYTRICEKTNKNETIEVEYEDNNSFYSKVSFICEKIFNKECCDNPNNCPILKKSPHIIYN